MVVWKKAALAPSTGTRTARQFGGVHGARPKAISSGLNYRRLCVASNGAHRQASKFATSPRLVALKKPCSPLISLI